MQEKTLPKLLVNREKAYQQIEAQIEKGKKLRDQLIDSVDQLEKVGLESENWSKYNTDLLTTLFENSKPVSTYKNFHFNRYSYDEMEDIGSFYSVNFLDYHLDEYQTDMTESISSLEGIRDRLELLDELNPPARIFGDKIFIVHGHDEAAKHKIARFVADLDLTATILDEQPSRGQTIIDKFEEHADEAGFAIVLLTADDVGAPKDKTDELKPRARQNVILELGYFFCGLGRDRVCILYEEDVELPSDIHGVIYVQMDKHGAWKLDLAQEMVSVGIAVDMNKLLLNR
jgi:hypothetical protein